MNRRRSLICTLLLSLALAACGLLQPRPRASGTEPIAFVTRFSSVNPKGSWPAGWFPAAAPQFRTETRYALVDDAGTTVVHATADGSSSGLALSVDIDPRRFPILRWRWKVPRPIPGADNKRRETDDAPARIQLAFAGDVSSLPFGERLFFTQVKATAGFDVPYATLEYSWGSGAPQGTIVVNQWTGRIRGILVRSGPRGMGEWVAEQRNVYEDFRAAFGEEPGRITQVGIWTDTDATGATAEAWYGDIELDSVTVVKE